MHGWINLVLEGNEFLVKLHVHTRTTEHYSRGDHGMGGGTYYRSHWTGEATVSRNQNKKLVAVCKLGNNDFPCKKDEEVKNELTPKNLLPDKHKEYADLVARKLISAFENATNNEVPDCGLISIDRKELVLAGVITDNHGQLHMPLVQ